MLQLSDLLMKTVHFSVPLDPIQNGSVQNCITRNISRNLQLSAASGWFHRRQRYIDQTSGSQLQLTAFLIRSRQFSTFRPALLINVIYSLFLNRD